MKNDEGRTIVFLFLLGIVPVIWLALLVAPFLSGGLTKIVSQFPVAMEQPFQIALCEDSRKTVLIFLLIYGLTIGVALSTRRNYRRGEEHGSARWGSASAINRKYRAKEPEANKVFTKHIRMGLDGRKHRRNLNTVMDEKYDLLLHPNVKFTPEKGGAPYVHGGTELSVGSLCLAVVSGKETKPINLSELEYVLLSDEEVEAELLNGGNTNEEHS